MFDGISIDTAAVGLVNFSTAEFRKIIKTSKPERQNETDINSVCTSDFIVQASDFS